MRGLHIWVVVMVFLTVQAAAIQVTIEGEGAYSFEERQPANLSDADISFAGESDRDLFEYPQFYTDNLDASIIVSDGGCVDVVYGAKQQDIIRGQRYCVRSKHGQITAVRVVESEWDAVVFEWEDASVRGISANDDDSDIKTRVPAASDMFGVNDGPATLGSSERSNIEISTKHLIILLNVVLLAGVVILFSKLRR